jgi:hypothetical protein
MLGADGRPFDVGRGCTSSVPVVPRHVVCLVTFPHPPLVALSAVSVGDLVVVTPGPVTTGGGTGGVPDIGGNYVGGMGRANSGDARC